MGRGDKKTKRGKISMGTFGKIRPHSENNPSNKPQAQAVAKEETKQESESKK